MSWITRLLWSKHNGDESGMSLITVMALGVIGTLFAISAMSYALGDNEIGAREREWVRALYAAEAGLNAYLWKMNDDPQYYLTDPAMRDPEYFPGEQDWTPVPDGEGEYRLTVTPQPKVVGKELTVTIEASGRVSGVVRTVQVDMARKTFLDWMYFTDYETYNGQSAGCRQYRKKNGDNNCAIQFANGDVLNGPIKSNDFIMLQSCNQPTFESTLESGRGTVYLASNGSDCNVTTPNYRGEVKQCGLTQFCDSVLPTSNAKLLGDAEKGGYVYWGPVEITPLANGYIRVYSRYGTAAVPPGPAQARTLGDAPPTSTTVDRLPPPNGVIYVKRKTTSPTSLGKAYVGTRNNEGWKGQLTIGSENSIWVWRSLRLNDETESSKDVVGLIANENIYIGDDRSSGTRRRPNNPVIHAAMLALNGDVHAYGIVNPPDSVTFDGCNGTLTIVGAFAQKTRGVVGLLGSNCGNGTNRGYLKNYVYDTRLGYVQPPRFMEPSNTSWRQLAWREVRATNP